MIEEGDEHYVVIECMSGGTMEQHCTRTTLLNFETVLDTVFKCANALKYMNDLA